MFCVGNEWINLCDAINYEGNEGNLKIIFGFPEEGQKRRERNEI